MDKKTISSQLFTKNGKFEIIKNFPGIKKDSYYDYRSQIKCVTCGEEQNIRTSHKERCICKKCKDNEFINKHIGLVYGVYTVASYAYKKGNLHYYNAICKNCNSNNIITLSSLYLSDKKEQNHCLKCKYEISIRKPTLDAPRNCVKGEYLTGAIKRNFEFNLTDEEFDKLIFSNCYYCGEPPKEYQSDKKFNKTDTIFKRNGIDRLNSKLGYFLDNCVPCCATCNTMKMSLGEKEFITHINKISNFFENKGSTTIETI